jgi:predicted ATPase
VAPRFPSKWPRRSARKHLLLVLDNCEHVIEVAARMSEALSAR